MGEQEQSGGGQTFRYNSSPVSARTRMTVPLRCCNSPEQVFGTANALAVLFASELTQDQLQTLINLLSFLVSALSTIVTQQQICEGITVQPSE